MDTPFVPAEIISHDNIIVGGLGGGADICNAFPVALYLLSLGKKVTMVGVNGSLPSCIKGGNYITNYSKAVPPGLSKESKYGKRVFEHAAANAIAMHIPESGICVFYISREGGEEGVAHALDIIAEDTNSTAILLIDGGGDSLFCDSHNNKHSATHSSDSDTMVIDALCGVVRADAYVGIVSLGIDTPEDYDEVIKAMMKEDAYIGEADLRGLPPEVLSLALKSMRSSIRMNKDDTGERDVSLTATALYCSFMGMFKSINTLASWGNPIMVREDFTNITYFNAYDMARVKHGFKTKLKPKKESAKKDPFFEYIHGQSIYGGWGNKY